MIARPAPSSLGTSAPSIRRSNVRRTAAHHHARRPYVGEHQMVVVPNGGGALRRKIRSTVGTDRGDEAKALLLHDSLHVGSKKSRGAPPLMPPDLRTEPGAAAT